MFFFYYFNLIFGFKLVILIYFFFVDGEIKLTYLLTYLLTFKPKLKKLKKIHPEKVSYISGNGTFQFQD